MTFTVGQEVLLTGGYRGRGTPREPETVTVVKVGHKYAYIEEYTRLIAFHVDNGVEKAESNYARRLMTPGQYAARQQRTAALARLRELGITGTGFGEIAYSTTTIEGMIRLLEADGGAITL